MIGDAVIGRRLNEFRKRAGLTLADAQDCLQITRPTMIAIEKGRRTAKASEVIALSRLYGCGVCDVMGGTSERINGASPLLAAAEALQWCDRLKCGDVSEGQFSRFLGVDRMTARIVRDQCETVAALLAVALQRPRLNGSD